MKMKNWMMMLVWALVLALGTPSAQTWADPVTPPQVANGGVTGTVTITTSGTTLLTKSATAYRQRVILVNNDATNPVYVAYHTPATTSDMPVKAGQSLTLNSNATIYAISTGASVSVSLITEEVQ